MGIGLLIFCMVLVTMAKKQRLTRAEKIDNAISEPILESRNKEYSKIIHSGRVTYLSIDKKTDIVKELSAKRFRSLKKIVKIKETTSNLEDAFYRTNQDLTKGIETNKNIYKRFKDSKGKTKFLEIDNKTLEIKRTMTFKRGLSIFRKAKSEKDIRDIMIKTGVNKKEARVVWKDKQEYLKENQIGQIMITEDKNREQAINFRQNLIKRGRMDTLIGSYTKFNPNSSYGTIAIFA